LNGSIDRARAWLLAPLLAFASALAAPAAAQDTREVTVNIGEQTSISAAGVQSYSEGVRGVADVRLTNDQTRFVIVGERVGSTSLLLIMEDGSQVQYRIEVVDESQPQTAAGPGIGQRENIRLDLYFVRVEDTYSHAIGVGFPGSIGGQDSELRTTVDYDRTVTGGVIEPIEQGTRLQLVHNAILPRIDIAQANGWARIYRQAALITANGIQAEFNAGGELNVAVQSGVQGTLEQIEFGTKLTCLPRFDPETQRIELQITAQVADLADDRGTGLPGLTTQSVTTNVNLGLGESIVLGGFVAQSETRSRTGLPGLSQIPILGALFGSHQRRFEASEGLMFIVPSVVDAVPLTQRNRIEELIRYYEDFDGDIDEVEILDHPRTGSAARRPTPTPTEEDGD
jgi:pilus assembly protein CpaC